MVYTLRFLSSKCSLFHNYNLFLVPVLFALYIQGVLKMKKSNSVAKGLSTSSCGGRPNVYSRQDLLPMVLNLIHLMQCAAKHKYSDTSANEGNSFRNQIR
jgi:hypothetical protein